MVIFSGIPQNFTLFVIQIHRNEQVLYLGIKIHKYWLFQQLKYVLTLRYLIPHNLFKVLCGKWEGIVSNNFDPGCKLTLCHFLKCSLSLQVFHSLKISFMELLYLVLQKVRPILPQHTYKKLSKNFKETYLDRFEQISVQRQFKSVQLGSIFNKVIHFLTGAGYQI